MQSTVSAAKGVFVIKNGFKASKSKSKKKSKNYNVEDMDNIFSDQLWYKSYSDLWNRLDKNVKNLNNDMFSRVLSDLVQYAKTCYCGMVTEVPTASLLTGINMPDHDVQFSTLAKEIKIDVTPHVAILSSQVCRNLKYLIENMVNQFVNQEPSANDNLKEDESSDEEISSKSNFKKNQLNFSLLQSWYEEKYFNNKIKSQKRTLVVIMTDFERFSDDTIQNFILIASTYLNILPFVLILGLATSVNVLHKTLPYHVSSKINVQVFNSQPSITYLNNVIENIFFSDDCPFNLSGKMFTLFTDIFLFYDFSVTGFIQNFKFAMLEHYSTGNAKALCTNPSNVSKIIKQFTHEDFENARQVLSFRKLVEMESYENQIKLLTNDNYFMMVLEKDIGDMFLYMENFYLFLKCLYILVFDLPRAPLGKQLRELYSVAASRSITVTLEYKQSFQLLNFQSADELTAKMLKLVTLIKQSIAKNNENCLGLKTHLKSIENLLDNLINITKTEGNNECESEDVAMTSDVLPLMGVKMDRQQLKQRLLQLSKESSHAASTSTSQPRNRYEKARTRLLDHISQEILPRFLKPPMLRPFHELFFFGYDREAVSEVQSCVVGAHRAAIHAALNDPWCYLKCPCCKLPNDSAILRSMPDIAIVYKLHLEHGKMINLYDWLQAFNCIINPVTNDDQDENVDNDIKKKPVDAVVQARFTQCVSDLEFLSFIKSSKRKVDHVARLTWGG